ncbi:MAG: glycosyltransferase family 2 protein [Nitrospirae bacterium]|nr:glycosyltransferase family 2 protein [Candidatus Manganitrophaceae bacterium]
MNDLNVSVIIINYNSSAYTLKCVQSIIKHTSSQLSYQIVIVDNNSEKQDFDRLKALSENPKVKVLRSKFNLGFSGGHMLGVQFTEAPYYFFLNNDCLLLNDCLSILYSFCEQNKTVALCAPQLFSDKMNKVCSFDHFPTLTTKFFGTGAMRLFSKKNYPHKKQTYDEPLKVDTVSGSTLFVRANSFFEVGGFDTNYFLYSEEEDLALRLSKKHDDTFLIPEAQTQHFGGGSTKKTLEIEKEFYISFLYFYRKNYGILSTQVLKIYLFLKLSRKCFKHSKYKKLAFFVLFGACLSNSLRHKQKGRTYEEYRSQSLL